MSSKPLISIGVPTYNRPEGLGKTLLAITRQTYKNLQIIVSDNGSPGNQVKEIVEAFSKNDPRIQFYGHEKNQGPTFNFRFVLEKAESNYFMWAADDDEWMGENFLEDLMAFAPSNVLVFPDAILKDNGKKPEYPLRVYENCVTQIDYVKTFCATGYGYPFYGLFNLKLFNEMQHKFEFDVDLVYYNEGTFLHKLFLKSPVKYVKEVQMFFSTGSSKPSYDLLLNSFFEYFKRVVLIYSLADLPSETKEDLIRTVFDNYTSNIKGLLNKRQTKIPLKGRVKKVLKILVKGRI